MNDPVAAEGVVGRCLVLQCDPAALHTRRLAALPAIVVAVVESTVDPFADVAADVVIDGTGPAADEIVADIDAMVGRCPQAATALALLLRDSHRRTLHGGLIAESTSYSMLQASHEFAEWRARTPARPVARTADPVLVKRSDHRLTITLNRPHRHNAINIDLRDRLVEALTLAILDDELDTVELRGAGPSFCSGGDLDEFGSFATQVDVGGSHLVRLARSPAAQMARLAPRLVARVHGHCIGGGIELAAFAGRIVADADTDFSLPEVAYGLVPGAGGTVSLPARIGRLRTAELALRGKAIDARTALAWGLVDELT